jgi:cation/acetate symporter
VDILKNDAAIFPYKHPALFSISIAFIGIFVFSKLDKSEQANQEHAAFENQFVRSQTGLGIDAAVEH